MDFEALREFMVQTQLLPRGIHNKRVLDAMRKVPRHLFVDEPMQFKAYDDMALSIEGNQTISQPYMVAIMTELLELKGNEKVLEIGTGSGYQAAILAELAKEVFSVERIASLAGRAEERLYAIGYKNIHIKVDDGTLGWPEESPFDRIIITAGAPKIPDPLTGQLSENGILLAPVGDRSSQQLMKMIKIKGTITEEFHTLCVFVPLIGKHGWKTGE
ncbi:MAG TPA: protein-L-isoaspartate(D-aspartate) O-methyltransferase [Thermodesulfovibrionales bacterium]|jgi:protein-L-isoaspartate(D-aspartate) O-methyltransferase|nr:protein-L-isoaspartate(D-aspartate) O-methyltransferase [Thermodesulfovibrionales bacterium]